MKENHTQLCSSVSCVSGSADLFERMDALVQNLCLESTTVSIVLTQGQVVRVAHNYSNVYPLARRDARGNPDNAGAPVASDAPRLPPNAVNHAIRNQVQAYVDNACASPWIAFADLELVVEDSRVAFIVCSPCFKRHERADLEAYMRGCRSH